jgi:hypothetical protein
MERGAKKLPFFIIFFYVTFQKSSLLLLCHMTLMKKGDFADPAHVHQGNDTCGVLKAQVFSAPICVPTQSMGTRVMALITKGGNQS